ncbi:MAG: hypothetical protein A3F84_21425 [Candidatus Handelsmanbacteria bacterium RIFCSPLOWO2_12_FULL_64_10]|uniref:Uncharacterized protein n=1 Tax=Handelsmanbacteria sp. (strain RIFCSPLOWO2_12_FULL_64_10) TaxID=1817868 RepID=A0A1F6CBU0_HANXR|nr:MAG: hypothetical protein A3F84_21425 [Candidatus Handelsmanbacteria bacterium RIFCSPLOWO2_12_FULL_64_10]
MVVPQQHVQVTVPRGEFRTIRLTADVQYVVSRVAIRGVDVVNDEQSGEIRTIIARLNRSLSFHCLSEVPWLSTKTPPGHNTACMLVNASTAASSDGISAIELFRHSTASNRSAK